MRANFRTLPITALALVHGFVLIGLPGIGVADEDPEAKRPAGIRDYHLRAIKETGVSPDGKGALRLLRALMPSKDKEQEITKLIAGLSADSFAQREAAELGLLRVGLDALPALQVAHESRELETAARAGRVISRIKRNREVLAPAIVGAFALIGRDRPPGGVAAILDVLPMLNDAWAESQGCELLPIIATATDRKPLEAVLKRGGPELTLIAAIQALAVIYKTEELAGLEPYMAATQPEAVQLATAHALANRGHRPVLAVIVRLLESDDGTTRWKALNLIKALSGEEFEGKPYVEKLPAKSLGIIKKWLRDKAPTAELHFPLKKVALKEISGYIASSFGEGVIVFDAGGKPVRKIACSPYDAQALPGNEVLVCERENDRVIIFDAAGKPRRIADDLISSPTDAELVSNGNLLVLENDIGRIMEIDTKGKHVWSIGGLNNPYDVDRLPNGNTLVADAGNGRLVEFDQEGDIVWQKRGLDFPNSVLRLEDGRTLYTTYISGGIVMLDPAGESLWERVFDGATLFSVGISAGRIHVSDGGSRRILILEMDGANSGTVDLDADFVDVGFVRE